MLLDADTLELASGVERLLGPAGIEDGALFVPGRNQYARLRVGRGGAGRARPAAGRRARRRGKGGPGGRRGRFASVLAGRGSGDRGRAALPEDARGARAEAAPAARLRPACPRRHGELRRVPADARGDRSLAAHRPRALAQLALHSGRGDGRALVSSGTAGRAAAGRGGAAVLRIAPEWEAYIEATGKDYTRSWWDARPHPRLGTLEVRIADQPTSVERSAALAALVQALCAEPPTEQPTGEYSEERVAAARGSAPTERLLTLVEPAARELGTSELVDTLREPAEALRQLEVGSRNGLTAVAADLVARTAA